MNLKGSTGPKLLITGAAGWLGGRLIEKLSTDQDTGPAAPAPPIQPSEIHGLVFAGQKLPPGCEHSRMVRRVEGNILDPVSCARFCEGGRDAVLIHTAGIIHPRWVRDFYRVNVQGTENLLRAAAAAGVRRVVAVSSNSPCGGNPRRDHRFTEESPYHPYMNYGRSKMRMEQVVRSFQDRGDLETVIVRAPWFYGPRQPLRQTLFFRMIHNGRVPLVGDGNVLRSMAYVDNLCDGLMLAAVSDNSAGQIFWIADERPYTMNEIIATVEEVLETSFGLPCPKRRIHLPGYVSTLARWADASLQTLGLYNQKIHVLSEMNMTIACDITKAQTILGYQPRVALREGMYRSLLWMQKEHLPL